MAATRASARTPTTEGARNAERGTGLSGAGAAASAAATAGQEDAAPDLAAAHYDLRHGRFEGDLDYYAGLTEITDGPIAELGCGTGRLLPALRAASGRPVIGIDISRAMLRQAARRLRASGVGPEVLLVQADLRRGVACGCGLAILALNTFCHFHSPAEQAAVLVAAHEALLPDGLLALDLPNPHQEFGARPEAVPLLEEVHAGPGGEVYEWSVVESDPGRQTMAIRTIYDRCDAGGRLWRQSDMVVLRLFYRFEMEMLLARAGFAVEAMLGDYDHSDYETDSPRLLPLARKR